MDENWDEQESKREKRKRLLVLPVEQKSCALTELFSPIMKSKNTEKKQVIQKEEQARNRCMSVPSDTFVYLVNYTNNFSFLEEEKEKKIYKRLYNVISFLLSPKE